MTLPLKLTQSETAWDIHTPKSADCGGTYKTPNPNVVNISEILKASHMRTVESPCCFAAMFAISSMSHTGWSLRVVSAMSFIVGHLATHVADLLALQLCQSWPALLCTSLPTTADTFKDVLMNYLLTTPCSACAPPTYLCLLVSRKHSESLYPTAFLTDWPALLTYKTNTQNRLL